MGDKALGPPGRRFDSEGEQPVTPYSRGLSCFDSLCGMGIICGHKNHLGALPHEDSKRFNHFCCRPGGDLSCVPGWGRNHGGRFK